MKKITSFFLALVMVVCIFGAMPVLAADEVAQLYLSQESAIANDEFELTLSAKNFKDVAAAQIQINFGEIKFISRDSAFIKTGDYSLKNGLFKYVAFDTSLNDITSIFGETDEEVTVCKFTLKAPATAKKDDVLDIQFTDEFEFIDANNNDVEVSLTKGTVTVTGDAKAQDKAPRPTVKSKTETSIVLNSVAGCEYSKDGKTWQKSPTFSGLLVNTTYKFYQRYAEKQGGYLVGQSSDVLSVATNNHSYKDIVTEATTSKNGKIVKMCSACGKKGTTTTIYAAKTVKLSATSYTYNGKTKTPTVTVKGSNGKTISKSYYTVKYASGRKNIGKYKVTVTFKGNYSGTKTLYFTINPKIKLSATKYTYDGKTKQPTVKITNSSGKKIATKYYSVSYSSGRKNVGKYTITIKFKKGHSGTYKETFTIVPKSTSVSKLTAAKKSLKVAIKKQSSQTTGYEIQYSTSKKFTSSTTKTKTIKSYKTTSTTIKSLKAKKTYYVRVRTYKTVGKTKYYSGWSTVKYKKTK